MRATDQYERGQSRIGQRPHRGFVYPTLFFQPGQRTEARGAAGVAIEKLIPGPSQTHQPQRVPSRSRIENNVIVPRRHRRITYQTGKLIKRGNFHCAGSRQLLLHTPQRRLRQQSAHRTNQALAIRLRRRHRINIERLQPRHPHHHRRPVAQRGAQYFIQIRRRIRTHQQHTPPRPGQPQRTRTRKRGLAHSPFAREKKKPRRARRFRPVQRQNHTPASSGPNTALINSGRSS